MAVETNEFFNVSGSSVVVTFDRDIQPGSFTPANIVSFTGPTGAIVPPATITFGSTGSVVMAYKGQQASPSTFAYTAATTASQLQTYLASIPGLTSPGSVTVNGNTGGPFTVVLAASLNPAQLGVVSGPATIATYTITANPSGTPTALAKRTFQISGFPATNR